MKNLILARHAKSSWAVGALDDHERPLNDRGERDAPKMGAALAQRGNRPGAIVSSTAVRALATARVLAEALGFPNEKIVAKPEIYLAEPRVLLREVQQFDEAEETVLLVGHNPGMHDFANLLAGGAVIESFPTLAVARLELNVTYWGEVEPNSGLLLELLTPRILRNDS